MKTAMTPEREREFEELLAYVGHFATVVWKVDAAAEIHPAKTIQRAVEQFGKSKVLAGLRQAANDTIEDTNNWSLEAMSDADAAFRSAGIVTVSEITRRYSANYRRIIKRGVIRSDTEYYLIHGVLIDQGNAVSGDERAHLQQLTEAYEARV